MHKLLKKISMVFLLLTVFIGNVFAENTPVYDFSIITTNLAQDDEFDFNISASGTFVIDWGDGSIENITRDNTVGMGYSHRYKNGGVYTIGISGAANGYSSYVNTAAINFINNTKIASVNGSLGKIFPTLDNKNSPSFIKTFYGCTNLTSISNTLFSGIYQGTTSMFDSTFYGCSSLTTISEKLFDGIDGNISGMFKNTFYNCSGLSNIETVTGNISYIPGNMFANINNDNATFVSTFVNTGLSTTCPDGTVPDGRSYFNPVASCMVPTEYNINYVLNGGQDIQNAPRTYISGTQMIITDIPYRSGYLFAGWCRDSKLTDCDLNQTISENEIGDKTFYANWIAEQNNKFIITTTEIPANTSVGLRFYVRGIFYIDWGDGTMLRVSHTGVSTESEMGKYYTHKYTNSGVYQIGISGAVSSYLSADAVSITFDDTLKQYINKLDGSLGKIFNTPVVGEKKTPIFSNLCNGCINLTSISGTLFTGIAYVGKNMFRNLFANCSSLTVVPDGLFASIIGNGNDAFNGTFFNCTALVSIPDNLFANVSGNATNMFNETFANCSQLNVIRTEKSDVNYVPYNFMVNVNNDDNNTVVNMFSGTNLLTQCPDGIPTDNRTFFAPYASCDNSDIYQISYVINGGTNFANAPTTYKKNIQLTIDGIPTRDGYLFNGWCDDAELTQNCSVTKVITAEQIGNKTMYAKWVERVEPKFSITTTEMPENTEFSFMLASTGVFIVDWGDGSVDTINQTTLEQIIYLHKYKNAGVYIIGISGHATNYSNQVYNEVALYGHSSSDNIPLSAISFYTDSNIYIEKLGGSLGAIFGPVSSGRVPRFYATFAKCVNLTEIPATLFSGIEKISDYMFWVTFYGCSKLGKIPNGLFDGIAGRAGKYSFAGTFYGCSLITEIPNDLFISITGASGGTFSATFLGCSALKIIPEKLFYHIDFYGGGTCFNGTFQGCKSLETIPGNLLGKINLNSHSWAFSSMFRACTSLKTIPEDLFSGVFGGAAYAFYSTFSGCSSLTSIPEKLFAGITTAMDYEFFGTFENCSALTRIPEKLFSGILGNSQNLFRRTFSGCSALTDVSGELFSGVTGAAEYMFADTFYGCSSLTSIPENLFSGVYGSASNMFNSTFGGALKLSNIVRSDGEIVNYIPSTMFMNVNNNTATTFVAIFKGTRLLKTCPTGLFNDGRNYWGGVVSCGASCMAGTYLDTMASSCVPCFGGTYSDTDGATKCNVCPTGTYTEYRGSRECISCDLGYNTNGDFAENHDDKTDCVPNTITVNYNDTQTTCTYGGDLVTPPAPQRKKGYTFTGWKLDGR